MVFARWRTVVFVNGCFWHRHPGCKRSALPKSNTAFWEGKFSDNVTRDRSNYGRLEAIGWTVIVLWQCEVRTAKAAEDALRSGFSGRL